MEIRIEPFSSIVDAVPLFNDERFLLTIAEVLQVVRVALVELSREKGRLQNSEQEHEEEHDDLQVRNLRN